MQFHLTTAARNAGFAYVAGAAQTAIGGSSISGSSSRLRIFQGPIPSPETLVTWTPTNLPSYYLVEFIITNAASNNGKGVVTLSDIASKVATLSGQATWFAMYNTNTNLLICGDVTDVSGSGAIRLNDLNIVAGQTYSMQNLSFTVPLNYVY